VRASNRRTQDKMRELCRSLLPTFQTGVAFQDSTDVLGEEFAPWVSNERTRDLAHANGPGSSTQFHQKVNRPPIWIIRPGPKLFAPWADVICPAVDERMLLSGLLNCG
jgi:hypothetical protein